MTNDLIKQEINWVDSDTQLEACCALWERTNLLALDTEFVRTTTYYPIAGLVQINDGSSTYLIDPKGINDWYPLIELIEDDARTIAMHSCSEDLEVLQMEIGTVPKKILDTQLANAFKGGESSLGYAALVKQELGLEIPKSETRSDWLQRPLSQPQIHYAALDVEYLYKLAQKLQQELLDADRLEWVLEEGRRLYRNFKRLQDVNNSYKRIKSAWKLTPRKLAVLMALSKWRENYAQQEDTPRNRVIKERSLFELALNCPQHVSKLRKIEGISERLIRTQGATIISIINEQLELDETALPPSLLGPLSKSDQDRYKQLKTELHELLSPLGIAPEVVLRKKELEALYRFQCDDDWTAIENYFEGWRATVIADKVKEVLKRL